MKTITFSGFQWDVQPTGIHSSRRFSDEQPTENA